jgi:hypothetical protein
MGHILTLIEVNDLIRSHFRNVSIMNTELYLYEYTKSFIESICFN